MSTAIVLSKSRAEHKEFMDKIKEIFGPSLTVVKPHACRKAGAKIIDCFCDEFLTLNRLMKCAPKGDELVLYALGDWKLHPDEEAPFGCIMQNTTGIPMDEFVRLLR